VRGKNIDNGRNNEQKKRTGGGEIGVKGHGRNRLRLGYGEQGYRRH